MVMQCVTVNMLSTGGLDITSTPPGASIYIDGQLQIGINTPATIPNLVEGDHEIKISLDGFNDYITTVTVIADTTTTVPDFILTPNQGCIYFTTNPSGASIYIDDTLRPETTPALICGLDLGHHTYKLVLTNYLDVTSSIDLVSGHGENISSTLVETGSLQVISTPSGASIYIDGVLQIGKTTPDIITDIPVGSYDIIISKQYFNDYTTTVSIEHGVIRNLTDIILIPNQGCMYFTTNPPGASIYIDNILQVGKITPAIICGLSQGHHTYRLYLNGYMTIIDDIDLPSGHGENISRNLEQVVEAGFGGGGMFLVAGLAVGYLLFMDKKKEDQKRYRT